MGQRDVDCFFFTASRFVIVPAWILGSSPRMTKVEVGTISANLHDIAKVAASPIGVNLHDIVILGLDPS